MVNNSVNRNLTGDSHASYGDIQNIKDRRKKFQNDCNFQPIVGN